MASPSHPHTAVIEGGFSDPVFQSQALFRATMDAMANPGCLATVAPQLRPPPPLSPSAAAIICTLADAGSPLWLDPPLSSSQAVKPWLQFHTGALVVSETASAHFGLIADPLAMPHLDRFALGTLEYPDRSTTLILQVDSLDQGEAFSMSGPGIPEYRTLAPAPLPAGFREQWSHNGGQFPRGIDLILAAPEGIVGLPRTVRLSDPTGV